MKGSLYAAHGIADYWIVNISDRQIEVYRQPTRDDSRQHGWRYGQLTVVRPPEGVSPLLLPDVKIEAGELLP